MKKPYRDLCDIIAIHCRTGLPILIAGRRSIILILANDSLRENYMARKTSALFIFLMVFLFSAGAQAQRQGKTPPERKPADKITLNFVDVELTSLVRIMSELTGRNFIYDNELIRGRVTIIAPEKLSSEEALSIFISALELKNFTIIPVGSAAYKIIPSASARQSGTKVLKESERARSDEYIVRLIPLEFISAQEAFPVVQPLVSRNGQVSVFGSRNSLLVVDTAQNIEKVLKILASVDKLPLHGEPELIYLQYAQAETIAQIIKKEEMRRTGGIRRGPEGGPNGDSNITPDQRLNAIILSGSNVEREFFKRFIALLDVPPPEASSRINVYYLENAEAEDLGRVLDSLLRAGGAPSAPAAPAGTAQPVATLTQELTGRISITPDKATNSLVIMASPGDYQSLVQVIQRLDRRPKQVFVEAMITEVTVDKAVDLGNKWRIAAEKDGKPIAIGGLGTVDATAIQTIINGLSGFTIGGLGNFLSVPVTRPDGTTFDLTAPGFAALFSLTDFRDIVNVLSTPHILTSDNTDAEIMVGENVPFLSRLEREPTTAAQPLLQSIERRDVGIRLNIRPKISEGGFVKLDIYQEISAISPTTTAGAADIITTKRSARTAVVVKNNQTVVIGGLIQDRNSNNTTKIPFLGDIPLIGWLFKSKSDRNQKTNLLVFITPYIVEDFQGLDEMKDRKEEEFREKSRTPKGFLKEDQDVLGEEQLDGK